MLTIHRLAFALACAAALFLSPACATTPTQASAIAGHTLAEVGAQYRRVNQGFVEGCVGHRIPLPTCGAWARFSAEFVEAYDPVAEAYLAGTDPAGPRWAELVAALGAFAAQLATLAAGGTP